MRETILPNTSGEKLQAKRVSLKPVSLRISAVCQGSLFNPFSHLVQDIYPFANKVDPDEMAHNKPPHLDLHCLPFCFWLTTVTSSSSNACVQMQRWNNLFQKLRVELISNLKVSQCKVSKKWSSLSETQSLRCLPDHAFTVEPCYLDLAYFELPLISKWKSGPCFNMKLWQQVTK